MSDPKSLLNRGLKVVDKEISKLETAAVEQEMGLLSSQRDDLCAYMALLRMLIGKDLGGEDNSAELTDEQLREKIATFTEKNKRWSDKS